MYPKAYIAKRIVLVRLVIVGWLAGACLPVGAQSQAQVSNIMPPIEVVGVGDVQRTSKSKNSSGLLLPPWTSVEVTNVFGFKKQPRAGSRVSFVPVDVDFGQFDLKLKRSVIQDGCDKSSPKWWSAEFEPVTDKRIFDIAPLPERSQEFPFDVVVIYPAVSSARQIPKSEIRPEMLPGGVKLGVVKAAIDVTSDGAPDLVITKYCCASAAKTTNCDMTCGATYKRSGKKWLKIDTSKPC